MDCRACQSDPSLKKLWGCDEPTQDAVWATDEEEFYNCPLRWISEQIIDWYEEYSYYTEFPGAAPIFGNMIPGWTEALQYYKIQYKHFYDLINPSRGKDSTSRGLSILRQSHANRG